MHHSSTFVAILACISTALATPIQVEDRALPICKIVDSVVSVLKIQKATPLCSSILSIVPKTVTQFATQTATVTQPTTVTSDALLTTSFAVTTSVPGNTIFTSTVYTTIKNPVFKSGEPPAVVKRDDIEERAIALPPWASAFGNAALSTACSCLSLATPTVTITAAATATATDLAVTTAINNIQTTVISTVTVSTSVYALSTSTVSTVYPCATAALNNPSSGSYLAENPGAQVGIQTHNFSAATITDCCNLCMFGQAYCRWASYDASSETCAITQMNGGYLDGDTNFPNLATCVSGGILGENFGPSGSSGLIAGPCGESYDYASS